MARVAVSGKERVIWLNRARAFLAPGALFAAALVVAALAAEVSQQLRDMRAAPSDDVRWTMLQLEVDVVSMESDIDKARAAAAMLETAPLDPARQEELKEALSGLRKRFDILWSRADVLVTGQAFAAIRAVPTVETGLSAVRDFLQAGAPLVDAEDHGLLAGLPELSGRIARLRPIARSAAVDGVQIFAERSDLRRQEFARLLQITALAALALIVALGITLAGLRRQMRISIRQGREASESRRRFASAVNASLDAIVVADAQGRILVWNHAAEQVFGYARSTAIGGDMAELIVPPNLRAFHRRGMQRYLETGERRLIGSGRQETRGLRADGAETPVEISIAAAHGEEGPIFISFIRDISDRIEADRALLRARDEAMAADRAKSDFIAVMSHEMRTPLNGVLGTLDLLARTDLTEPQLRYLRVAMASGEILLRHVNDVLDIARIEANRFEPDPAPFDPARLLEELQLVTRPLIEEGGNRFRIANELPPGGLIGDARRIEQVLLNLLGNAAKFTNDGEVVLEARAIELDPGRLMVEFAVRDDGPGVAIQDQARIFEDFVTLDASYERKSSGTGLGLGICRRIVQALDGKIGVESAPEEGARFWIRLPMLRAARTATPETGRPAAAGGNDAAARGAPAGADSVPVEGALRVLVVEDNETNRFVVREMLESAGCAVRLAHDGRAGVEAAAGERFDLILMDISMPGMDGVAATKAILGSTGPNRDTTILGLTAHALPEEQERFRKAGMTGCLTKPLRLSSLHEALREHGIRRTEAAPGEMPDEPPEDEEDDDDPLDASVLADLSISLPGPALAQLLQRAAQELSEGAQDLALLARSAGPAQVGPAAHKLAGTAALVGAVRVHAALSAVEAACKQDDLAAAAARIDALPPLLEEALPALAEIATESGRNGARSNAAG